MALRNIPRKEIIIICLFIAVFIGVSVLAQREAASIKSLIEIRGIGGMVFYVILGIVADVIAPMSSLPVLPIAVALWGSFLTAILSFLSWMIGAVIVYWLSRKYGKKLAAKFVNLERIEKISHYVPRKHLFWAAVLLRIVLPADLSSYALSLFTRMDFKMYFFTTFIGLIPFAFIYSYGVALPIGFQITIGAGIIAIILILYRRIWPQIYKWLGQKKEQEQS